jgi:hypothetical protein
LPWQKEAGASGTMTGKISVICVYLRFRQYPGTSFHPAEVWLLSLPKYGSDSNAMFFL